MNYRIPDPCTADLMTTTGLPKAPVVDVRAVNYVSTKMRKVDRPGWGWLPWSMRPQIWERHTSADSYAIQVRRAGSKDWEDLQVVTMHRMEKNA